MKNCPNCNAPLDDNAAFCTNCGAQLVAPQPAQNQVPPQGQPVQNQMPPQGQPYYQAPPAPAYADPYDHTAEYDPKDISDHKVFAMLPYILGIIGIIIALLATHESKYTMFHIRQALKFTVVNILILIITLILCWTIIVPIAAGIMSAVLFVIQIICFFQVCNGKAKEPVIIRSLGFLK